MTVIGSLRIFEIAKNPAPLYSITDKQSVLNNTAVSCFLLTLALKKPETYPPEHLVCKLD